MAVSSTLCFSFFLSSIDYFKSVFARCTNFQHGEEAEKNRKKNGIIIIILSIRRIAAHSVTCWYQYHNGLRTKRRKSLVFHTNAHKRQFNSNPHEQQQGKKKNNPKSAFQCTHTPIVIIQKSKIRIYLPKKKKKQNVKGCVQHKENIF